MDAATITAISVAVVAILGALTTAIVAVRTLVGELRHNTSVTAASTRAIISSKDPGYTGTVLGSVKDNDVGE